MNRPEPIQHDLFSEHLFATPAVRHLAWLITATPLLQAGSSGTGGDGPELQQELRQELPQTVALNWPTDAARRLIALDREPGPLLDHLARRNGRRLGLYFEQLYGFALRHFLGQRILAQNLPVRRNGRTLGELDFLVQDPRSGRVVHHEIAVKFYMGWAGGPLDGNAKPPGWYGPDSRDQLAVKLRHLYQHQVPMGRHDLTTAGLAELGLPVPDASHVGLYGYLFQHRDNQHQANPGPPLPAATLGLNPRTTWISMEDAASCYESSAPGPQRLVKPHWLGPMQLPPGQAPDPAEFREELAQAQALGKPILVATLEKTEAGFWLEQAREFITPTGWCYDGD